MKNSKYSNLHSFYKRRDYSLFGVIGDPVSHSLSPELHNNWFKQIGLEHKVKYVPINVKNKKDLKDVLLTMPKMGFIGCNITAPFKEEAYKIIVPFRKKSYRYSSNVLLTQAINCVFFQPEKDWWFDNTDLEGFQKTIKNLTFSNVLIIGAGSVAKTIATGCLMFNNAKVSVANRTYRNLVKQFKSNDYYTDINIIKMQDIKIQDYDLIINATSLGWQDNQCPDIKYEDINSNAICYDVVYDKDKLTPFLSRCNLKVHKDNLIDGYQMLVNQAQLSFQTWTGVAPWL